MPLPARCAHDPSTRGRDRAAAAMLLLAVAVEVGSVLAPDAIVGAAPAVAAALRWSSAVAAVPITVLAVGAAGALLRGSRSARPLAAAAGAVGAIGLVTTGTTLLLIEGSGPGADAAFATAADLALLAGGALAIAAWQDHGRPLPTTTGWRPAPALLGLLVLLAAVLPSTASTAGGATGLRGALWHTAFPWWVPTVGGHLLLAVLVLAAARLAPTVIARAAAAAAATVALPPVLVVWTSIVALDLDTSPTVWFLFETVGALGLALVALPTAATGHADDGPAANDDQVSSAVA